MSQVNQTSILILLYSFRGKILLDGIFYTFPERALLTLCVGKVGRPANSLELVDAYHQGFLIRICGTKDKRATSKCGRQY